MSSTNTLMTRAALPSNGNGDAIGNVAVATSVKPGSGPAPLTDELVAATLKGRGLHGWFRLARVTRVLGLFTLYLFLDTYDVRAEFNRRMVARLREEARQGNLTGRLKVRGRLLFHLAYDRLITLLRLIVFPRHQV